MAPKSVIGIQLILLVALTQTVDAQTAQVVELRCTPPSIAHFLVETQAGATYWPEFVGDVNGDGFDDFLMTYPVGDDDFPDSLLVYGSEGIEQRSPLNVENVAVTRFVSSEDFWPHGQAHAALGDIDSDGYADFLLASDRTPWEGEESAGALLVVFGSPHFPRQLEIESLESSNVRFCRIISKQARHYAGKVVSEAGDLNGDGKVDFAVAARADGTENGGEAAGRLYVVFGGFDFSHDIELADIGSAVPGLIIHGANGQLSPGNPYDALACCDGTIATLGDVNGDGFDDLAVGAYGVSSWTGSVYLVLGGPELEQVSDLFCARPGGPLVELQGGIPSGGFGRSVAGIGDVNGDGLADILVGALHSNAAHVIFGKEEWSPREPLDQLHTFTLVGKDAVNAPLGEVIASLGDFNGDGYADFVATSQQLDIRYGSNVGEAYLVYGGPNLSGPHDAAAVGSALLPGVTIRGEKPRTWFGRWAEGGGDFNGDGWPDLLVAAESREGQPSTLPKERSSIYVFYGRTDFTRPALFSVTPTEGSILGGYEVTLCGSGFSENDQVTFGGQVALEVDVLSSAELHVVVPPRDQTGLVDVEITGQNGTAYLEGQFRYTQAPHYPDLLLDPGWLKEHGYRVLVFTDTLWAPPTSNVGQFFSAFIADLNGDALDDLLVGEVLGGPEGEGAVSIIFGSQSLPEVIDVGDTETYGTVVLGRPGTIGLGPVIAFPGDLNGDGFNDLAIGWVAEADQEPTYPSGEAYVLFGRRQWPPVVRVEEEVARGSALRIRNQECGRPDVAGPGDFNRDGVPDLVLGYHQGIRLCEGEQSEIKVFGAGLSGNDEGLLPSIVIRGDPTTIPLLNPLDTGGQDPRARAFGTSVAAGGDLNADGQPDLIVGAGHALGAFYFVFGGQLSGENDIANLVDTARALVIPYEHQTGYFGEHAASLGDFNGDGVDDAALGSPAGGWDYEGLSFVVFGSTDFGESVRELSVLRENGGRWVTIEGEYPYDWTGYVEAVGDVNGDGLADLGITGANLRTKRGGAYVVFGSAQSPDRISLSHLGSRGFRLTSAEGNWLSRANGGIAGGDLDGDGFTDLAVGEAVAGTQKRILVVFGRPRLTEGFVQTGDVNADGDINIADAIRLLSYLFNDVVAPPCMKAADANDDDSVNIADTISILSYLFASAAITLPDGTTVFPAQHPGCIRFGAADVPHTIEGEPGCASPCTP